jgi:CheY-like chemotaxis protein
MARILVVEDNEMNLDMLSRRLEKRGHTVLVATDGEQAVDVAHHLQPELILMDMSLPVMDGWQATRVIKASAETHHIPIIALTAHAVAGDRERSLEAGCDDYETKPVKFAQLIEKINSILGIES